MTKQKIVVLGGGVGALSAVYEITDQQGWQDKYEITVYQMGWRLGGKGASGRNQGNNDRIEEHGFHVWFGFYENAFNVMWRCYDELGRSPNAPLPTVQQAFTGIDTYDFMEYVNGEYIPWYITFPHDDNAFPGNPNNLRELPSLWEYFKLLLNFINNEFYNSTLSSATNQSHPYISSPKPNWWQRITTQIEADIRAEGSKIEASFINHALKYAESLDNKVLAHSAEDHKIISWFLKEFQKWLNAVMDKISMEHTEIRRLWIILDLALTCAIGMLEDGVFTYGLNIINKYEFTEWLTKHGASKVARDSAPVQAIYDAAFAYTNGDTTQRNMCAGVYVRAMLRILFTYQGHVLYKMNAGMGDTIFAPLYEVLERRGVNFQFFHRVLNLEPDEERGIIKSIQLGRQVDLNSDTYQPLFLVKGLPCWPSEPFYEQIKQGDELKEKHINLESRWANWQDVENFSLNADNGDFDICILGISIAALNDVCSQLIQNNAAWNLMMSKMMTVKTQAMQLWFNKTAADLGYGAPTGIIGSYMEPYASWVDFSQLIQREDFPASADVNSIIYSCGVMLDGDDPMPPPSDHAFPAQQTELAKQGALDLLKTGSGDLFPQASDASGELDWSVLVDQQGRQGENRFNAQYWRANIDPTERYDQSVKGSDEVRLKTDESGYSNLILAGTWINNGFNLSAVEAGVMAGMQASRAITGEPQTIIGEGDILDD